MTLRFETEEEYQAKKASIDRLKAQSKVLTHKFLDPKPKPRKPKREKPVKAAPKAPEPLRRLPKAKKIRNRPAPDWGPRFAAQCRNDGIPTPELEYRFDEVRRWRFDVAWPDLKIALEVEGAIWTGGRHTRGSGFLKDMEKYNAAARQGWRLFRFTPHHIKQHEAVAYMKTFFGR